MRLQCVIFNVWLKCLQLWLTSILCWVNTWACLTFICREVLTTWGGKIMYIYPNYVLSSVQPAKCHLTWKTLSTKDKLLKHVFSLIHFFYSENETCSICSLQMRTLPLVLSGVLQATVNWLVILEQLKYRKACKIFQFYFALLESTQYWKIDSDNSMSNRLKRLPQNLLFITACGYFKTLWRKS